MIRCNTKCPAFKPSGYVDDGFNETNGHCDNAHAKKLYAASARRVEGSPCFFSLEIEIIRFFNGQTQESILKQIDWSKE